MTQYVVRRLLLTVPTLFVVSLLVFGLVRLLPGDAVVARAAEGGGLTPDQHEELRARLGLDRPFLQQYAAWVGGVFRGDLGRSLWTDEPATARVARALPITLELTVIAVASGVLLAVPVGIVSAAMRGTPADYGGRLLAVGLLSVPDFWLGTVVLIFGSIYLGWVPPPGYAPLLEDPARNLQQFVVPGLILGVRFAATGMRMMRSSLLEVLRQDYIRTARAKGLAAAVVVRRHALPNAIIPVITIFGLQVGYLLGGALVVENIFSLPGIGQLTYQAVIKRDYTQLQANVVVLAAAIIAINLAVDIAYTWLDRRVHL